MANPVKMRIDGSRNRAAILNAAREVFATVGVNAPLALVAQEAGVSRMTLYRNFVDRDALVMAIFEAKVQELALLGQSVSDQDDGLFVMLEAIADANAQNNGLSQVFAKPTMQSSRLALRSGVIAIMAPLLARARSAGRVRDDIGVEDLELLLTISAAGIREDELEVRRAQARRTLDLMLRGICGSV
jgi:AcrR family transcriptional regulator